MILPQMDFPQGDRPSRDSYATSNTVRLCGATLIFKSHTVGNPEYHEQPSYTERSKACKIANTFGQYLLVKLVTNVPVH